MLPKQVIPVRSLVGELRSHMPSGVAKKNFNLFKGEALLSLCGEYDLLIPQLLLITNHLLPLVLSCLEFHESGIILYTLLGTWFLPLIIVLFILSSSVHGIFQARILKWVAVSYSRGSS